MPIIADEAKDAGLDKIQTDADLFVLCNAQPTTYAEANSTFRIASVSVADADFAKADGDTDGRKLTLQPNGAGTPFDVTASATDTATHWAVIDTINSVLYCEGTFQNVALTDTETQAVNPIDVAEIGDAVAA